MRKSQIIFLGLMLTVFFCISTNYANGAIIVAFGGVFGTIGFSNVVKLYCEDVLQLSLKSQLVTL